MVKREVNSEDVRKIGAKSKKKFLPRYNVLELESTREKRC